MTDGPRVVDTSASPHARLDSVAVAAVRWMDGFWGDRFRQNCEVTLRRLWDLLADPDAGHVLDNFRIAAGTQEGEFAGTDWQDEWLYKWLEAAACTWRLTGEAWIGERMDGAIELIAAAQDDDGYLATQVTATGRARFQDPRVHEVYSMGHLLTAGVVHHRMTGKRSLLDVAIRTADFLCGTLGVSVKPCYAHNPSAVMGLVELYRETGERRYLDCAKLIVDRRGEDPKPGGVFHQGPGIEGTDLIQDRIPLRREQEVVGHNVFFTYLFAGATDVYLETGDETLVEPLERLWRDLTERKMCVNGGVSPVGHGLSLRHDPVVEAVGAAYNLPCADAYNETCGQIGNMMWNFRMLCRDGEARFADVMELSIYNSILSGIGLDGVSWWYRNALRRCDERHVSTGLHDHPERGEPGRRSICCPSNLVRTLAEWHTYLCTTSDDGVWVHHYGASVYSGQGVAIEQATDYPWDGKVTLTVTEAPGSEFAVRLRVPGWCEEATLAVNGEPFGARLEPNTYATVKRAWAAGDVIELDLPMPVRLVQAHPKVEQLRGQAAVFRGPLLYCLESPDVAEGVDLSSVYLPGDIDLSPAPADDVSPGFVALEGEALYRPEAAWDSLYRPLGDCPLTPMPIRLVPYFAWANRGPAAMSVWLPLVLKA